MTVQQFVTTYWPQLTTLATIIGTVYFCGRYVGRIETLLKGILGVLQESKADIKKLTDTVHDHGERISKLEGVHLRKE